MAAATASSFGVHLLGVALRPSGGPGGGLVGRDGNQRLSSDGREPTRRASAPVLGVNGWLVTRSCDITTSAAPIYLGLWLLAAFLPPFSATSDSITGATPPIQPRAGRQGCAPNLPCMGLLQRLQDSTQTRTAIQAIMIPSASNAVWTGPPAQSHARS